ncbi:hypothetical protein [Methylobacterium radiotolerans]
MTAALGKAPETMSAKVPVKVAGRKPIMGTDVEFETVAGHVTRVEDASYEQRWKEYAGTDHHWQVRGNAAGRVDRADLYVHHYVERSETVGRNKVTVTTGKDRRESNYWLGTDRTFVVGDEVAVVRAGYTEVLLFNRTRDVKVLSDWDIYAEPAAEGTLDRVGRFLSKRGRTFGGIVASGAAGLLLGLPVHAPALGLLGPTIILFTWLAAVPQWRSRCSDFQNQVRAVAMEAIKQLELVRGGMSLEKAQEAAFGHDGRKALPRGGKPFWMAVCELLGATTIPPRFSAEDAALELEYLQDRLKRRQSNEVRPRTKFEDLAGESYSQAIDEVTAARAAGKEDSTTMARALDRHDERMKQYAHLRPRPKFHMRSKGYDIYKWELQWGPPKWPEGYQHHDVDMAYYLKTRLGKSS